MIIKSARFVTSAVKPAQYPPAGPPEIAFAGRSNVGKSSLINKLVNRKALVKTSRTPGRTQLINFFSINENLMFVDLPGYGYARVPERVKKNWGPMVETYITARRTLRSVVMLMDIRRTPGDEEHRLNHWLAHLDIPVIRILTKADKLSKTRQKKQLDTAAKSLQVGPEDLILFSAKSGKGRDALWEAIHQVLSTQKEEKG